MGVVRLADEVGDRELELIDPEPHRVLARGEILARAQKEKNVGGLADEKLAAFEERRSEWRMRDALAVEQRQHRRHAVLARPARDVDIVRAGFFEREAHEFAAALDVGPVIEFIAHDEFLRDERIFCHPARGAAISCRCGRLVWGLGLLTSRNLRPTLGAFLHSS